jgi:hypothetical protein
MQTVNKGTFQGVLRNDKNDKADEALETAYSSAYSSVQANVVALLTKKTGQAAGQGPATDPLKALTEAQGTWKKAHLEQDKEVIQTLTEAQKVEVGSYLKSRIESIERDINDLQSLLPQSKVFLPAVIDETGTPVNQDDIRKSSELLEPPVSEGSREKPSSWTRVCDLTLMMCCSFVRLVLISRRSRPRFPVPNLIQQR